VGQQELYVVSEAHQLLHGVQPRRHALKRLDVSLKDVEEPFEVHKFFCSHRAGFLHMAVDLVDDAPSLATGLADGIRPAHIVSGVGVHMPFSASLFVQLCGGWRRLMVAGGSASAPS